MDEKQTIPSHDRPELSDQPLPLRQRIDEPQRDIVFSDNVWTQSQYDRICANPLYQNQPECTLKQQIQALPCEEPAKDPLSQENISDIPHDRVVQWYGNRYDGYTRNILPYPRIKQCLDRASLADQLKNGIVRDPYYPHLDLSEEQKQDAASLMGTREEQQQRDVEMKEREEKYNAEVQRSNRQLSRQVQRYWQWVHELVSQWISIIQADNSNRDWLMDALRRTYGPTAPSDVEFEKIQSQHRAKLREVQQKSFNSPEEKQTALQQLFSEYARQQQSIEQLRRQEAQWHKPIPHDFYVDLILEAQDQCDVVNDISINAIFIELVRNWHVTADDVRVRKYIPFRSKNQQGLDNLFTLLQMNANDMYFIMPTIYHYLMEGNDNAVGSFITRGLNPSHFTSLFLYEEEEKKQMVPRVKDMWDELVSYWVGILNDESDERSENDLYMFMVRLSSTYELVTQETVHAAVQSQVPYDRLLRAALQSVSTLENIRVCLFYPHQPFNTFNLKSIMYKPEYLEEDEEHNWKELRDHWNVSWEKLVQLGVTQDDGFEVSIYTMIRLSLYPTTQQRVLVLPHIQIDDPEAALYMLQAWKNIYPITRDQFTNEEGMNLLIYYSSDAMWVPRDVRVESMEYKMLQYAQAKYFDEFMSHWDLPRRDWIDLHNFNTQFLVNQNEDELVIQVQNRIKRQFQIMRNRQ